MNPTLALAAALLLAPQTNSPIPHDLPSNTFITGAESVLDNALATDVTLPDDQFNAHLKQIKDSRDNLKNMSSNPREDELVDDLSSLIFQISSCHLQAVGDASKATTCRAQIDRSIHNLMTAINHHKSGQTWVAGPPA